MTKLKKHLCAALKRALDGGRLNPPAGGDELLAAFLALSRARSIGPAGPNPISWEALAAWMQVTRTPLLPHHAEIIMALDDVWLTHMHRRDAGGAKTLPPISQQPLSAALFDAVVG